MSKEIFLEYFLRELVHQELSPPKNTAIYVVKLGCYLRLSKVDATLLFVRIGQYYYHALEQLPLLQ